MKAKSAQVGPSTKAWNNKRRVAGLDAYGNQFSADPDRPVPAGDDTPITLVLTPEQTARELQLSLSTLARMRVHGNGPPYVQLSRQKVGYRRSDLENFLESRVRISTSQL